MANGHGGKRQGAGRKPEALTIVTRELKETIMHALDASHKDGGFGYLKEVAKKDHKTFCALLGRILPLQHANDPDNPFEPGQNITIRLTGPNGADD